MSSGRDTCLIHNKEGVVGMKKLAVGVLALLIICGMSMYSSNDKIPQPTTSDLRIWFPSGYELMKKKDMNDIAIVHELEKRLNIPLYYKNVSGDIDSMFQAQMSDLADVDMLFYNMSPSMLNAGLENERFYNYYDDIDQMPNLKKQFEQHPELYDKACPDNVCILFPSTKEHAYVDMVLAYRDDWAKQVGVDELTNLDDVSTMLKAQKQLFNEGQLAQQDKYYIGLSSFNSYVRILLNMFETSDSIHWDKEHKQLLYGPSTSMYRSYLLYLKDLFQHGVVDPRLFEPSMTDMEKFFLNSQSGAILTNYAHANKLSAYAYANGDSIPLTYVYPYQLKEHKAIYSVEDKAYQVSDFGYVIKAGLSEQKQQQALAYIDYLYSDEGMQLYNFGIEGTHFTKEKDTKRYMDKITKENEYYPIAISTYVKPDLLRVDKMSDFTMLQQDAQTQIQETAYEDDYSFVVPKGFYTKEERELVNTIEISLATYVEETSMNFIFKDIDPSDPAQWNSFVEGMQHMGLSDYMEIQYKAYERSINNTLHP